MLLINHQGLVVYTIDSGVLTAISKFEDSDEGHESFSQFAADRKIDSAAVIVDSSSEDFIIETVAHVLANDRAALLKRKLDHHFRNTRYRSAAIIGRETKGRKDDRVLFSALTKNEVVDPWTSCLLQDKIRITSISSPAFAIQALEKELKFITHEHVLVANWERSGIRQSYFQKGRMVFSRLAPSPGDDLADLPQAIVDLCVQSKEYIQRKGLVGFDENLHVHVITPFELEGQFNSFVRAGTFPKIETYNTSTLIERDQVHQSEEYITALTLCIHTGLTKRKLKNAYGSSGTRRYHILHQWSVGIRYAGLAIWAVVAGLSAPIIIQILEDQAQYESLSNRQRMMDNQYAQLTADFPETPIPSYAMEIAVGAYENIVEQRRSPMEALRRIAAPLSAQNSIALQAIEWRMEPNDISLNETQALLDYRITENVDIIAEIVGDVGFQEADEEMQEFIDRLSSVDGAEVTALRVPVDSRPEANVSAVVGDDSQTFDFVLNIKYPSEKMLEVEAQIAAEQAQYQ